MEGEPSAHTICPAGASLATPHFLDRMRGRGILGPGSPPAFTPDGHRRAESLIRRHRLAETLFSETFQMHESVVEAEACYFEHILSPAVTDSICAFLRHPLACPHQKAIPRGGCCRERDRPAPLEETRARGG
ncbi:MAG TPA: iron dependent repressor, metal binding and dimerization domain protein [Candidatus Polarisedimenticolia bacterium]|nr:iron dependent repressor, metal binding and dimerization domain protein [Candidatus Polarisedimenticolia bacterium]